MNISMYQASAPRFANTLRNLSALLDKGQAHCEARKIDPAVMGGMRLIAVECAAWHSPQPRPAVVTRRSPGFRNCR